MSSASGSGFPFRNTELQGSPRVEARLTAGGFHGAPLPTRDSFSRRAFHKVSYNSLNEPEAHTTMERGVLLWRSFGVLPRTWQRSNWSTGTHRWGSNVKGLPRFGGKSIIINTPAGEKRGLTLEAVQSLVYVGRAVRAAPQRGYMCPKPTTV